MGLGQTMLTAAFFVLLIVMFMNAYRVINSADAQVVTSETYKAAGDLARSMMAEILTKKFDANTTPSSAQTSLTPFTQPWNLGPDASSRPQESITLPDRLPLFNSILAYDDVDDYNGYSRIDSANGLGAFTIRDTVYYVDATRQPPSKTTSSKMWYKEIDVWVTQQNYMVSNSGAPAWVKLTAFVTNTRKQ